MAVIPAHVADGQIIDPDTYGNPVLDALTEHESEINNATTGNAALGSRVSTLESGRVPNTRTISTTNGLQGGGDLSANRTLSPVYGTGANTVAQGNDSRITVTQDATMGNSALNTRLAAREAGPLASGSWRAANSTQQVAYAPSGTAITVLTFGTVVKAPVGMSINAANQVVTVTAAGWYSIQVQFDLNVSQVMTHLIGLSITNSAQTVTYGASNLFYPSNAWTSGSASALVYLNAGDTFQGTIVVYTGSGGSGYYTNSGPGVNRTNLTAVKL